VSVFFDDKIAYDTTRKYGILRDLQEDGIRGDLRDFISKLLNKRCFHVRVGSCLSDLFDQEMGVPQGAILSCYFVHIETMGSLHNEATTTYEGDETPTTVTILASEGVDDGTVCLLVCFNAT